VPDKRFFKPPKHLVEKWPEVFEDLYVDTMPVVYMDKMRINFQDGREWEVDVKTQLTSNPPEAVAEALLEMIDEYKNEIQNLDFDMDVELLKKDIKNKTKNLL